MITSETSPARIFFIITPVVLEIKIK